MNEKEKRLFVWCKLHGYDGVLLRRRSNIAWLTDGADVHVDSSSSTGVATLLWTPRKKVVFTSNIESPRLVDEELRDGWTVQAHEWWKGPRLPKGRFGTDFPEDPFADLRAPLTDLEIERIRALGVLSAEAVATVLKLARPGWSEHSVAGQLVGLLRSVGLFAPVVLVAGDARIARYRHPIPTSRRVEKTLMVALCARQHGLTVAVTRLVHFGKRLPSDLRRKHDAVCRIDAALHAATRPGARWCDVFAEGIRVYRETGFAQEWKKHHQGGPMGYEGRDFRATPSETRRVAFRQPVGWNPSIAGTKSEDTILSNGEVLTAMPDWPLRTTRPDILCRG